MDLNVPPGHLTFSLLCVRCHAVDKVKSDHESVGTCSPGLSPYVGREERIV